MKISKQVYDRLWLSMENDTQGQMLKVTKTGL